MKPGIAVGSLTLLLVACSPSDRCQEHADRASCEAAKACVWREKKSKCKTGDARVPAPTTETMPTPSPVPGRGGAAPTQEPNVVPEPTSPPEPNVVPEPTSPPEPPVAEPTPPEPPIAEPTPPSPPPANDQ
jgi:outer membrane biosynthesis protein TonB